MWLIKDYKTGRYYKTRHSIENDRLCSLNPSPFIKSGAMAEDERGSERKCTDKWNSIETVCRFDGRMDTWMRDCEWFTWLIVTEYGKDA